MINNNNVNDSDSDDDNATNMIANLDNDLQDVIEGIGSEITNLNENLKTQEVDVKEETTAVTARLIFGLFAQEAERSVRTQSTTGLKAAARVGEMFIKEMEATDVKKENG